MRKLLLLLTGCGFILLAGSPFAQSSRHTPCAVTEFRDGTRSVPATLAQKKKEKNPYAPPEVFMPNDEVLKQIAAKTAQLADKIAELRKDKKHHELLPDVEIFLRGAENIVRFKEFYHKDSGKWTLDALERGIKRAAQLAKGETPWTK